MKVLRLHRRHVVRSVAFCALVSLAPVAVVMSPAAADSPAASISGLTQGARGESVRAVQQALINQGITVRGGADGVFGAATTDALRQFQSAKGLPVTGIVDDATALALGLASSPLLGLTQGTRGAAVTDLQQRLLAAGIAVRGGADGIFGAGTGEALRQFQSSKGLPATGVVDAATASALGGVQVSSSNGPSTGSSSSSNGGSPSSGSLVGLKIGSRGDAVKQLQQQLIAAGHRLAGGADGVFGVVTATALGAFQTSAGLKPTAVVDDATVAALAAAPAASGGQSGGQGATSPLLGLKYGSTGPAVKTLQETLVKAGVPVRGGADGVFGLATQNALRQYQQAVGVATSGRVDEPTASALASGRSISGGASASGLEGLKAGSVGTSVRELQQALIKAGVSVRGGADGIFGPATVQALSAFQTSQGLPATGVADAATVAALANPKPVTGGGGGGAATGGFAQFGEKGARVVALQSALVKAGITVRGGVDGSFGAGTSAAVMDFQRANGLRVTGRVDEATAAKLGLGAQQPPAAPDVSSVTLQAFPVQGRCYFTDTWMAVRSGGRAHLGVDIIAPQGKLIYAVTDGTITRVYTDYPGSLAGNGVRLTQGDGTYFFYAHMVSIAEGIGVGSKVKAGQVIGYVGSTGSSATNHLHFEVHPKGGSAVNPYPMVKAIDGCARTEPLPQ